MFAIGKTYKGNVKSGRADGPGWETWMNCKVLEEEGRLSSSTVAGRSAA